MTTITKPNADRLRAVIADIRANPERHKQAFFHAESECGTTECFAGRAIVLFAPEGWSWQTDTRMGKGLMAAWSVTLPDGSSESVSLVAADLLGLNDDHVDALFYCMVDDPDYLSGIVERIIAGHYDEDGEE